MYFNQSKLSYKLLTNFRYHIVGNHKDRGFQIEYKTLEFFSECGGNYSNSTGILTSPLYPYPYPQLANCIYLISQPKEKFIKVSFLTINIDSKKMGFASDYIEMRDGNSVDSPLMGKLYGNNTDIPVFMISSQNHLRIR